MGSYIIIFAKNYFLLLRKNIIKSGTKKGVLIRIIGIACDDKSVKEMISHAMPRPIEVTANTS